VETMPFALCVSYQDVRLLSSQKSRLKKAYLYVSCGLFP
jgi:hypothetical protein